MIFWIDALYGCISSFIKHYTKMRTRLPNVGMWKGYLFCQNGIWKSKGLDLGGGAGSLPVLSFVKYSPGVNSCEEITPVEKFVVKFFPLYLGCWWWLINNQKDKNTTEYTSLRIYKEFYKILSLLGSHRLRNFIRIAISTAKGEVEPRFNL